MRGTALTGSYADILAQLPASAPQAAIVLFGNAGGENAFLRELHRRLPCPMAGGAAAIDPVTGRSHLIPGRAGKPPFCCWRTSGISLRP